MNDKQPEEKKKKIAVDNQSTNCINNNNPNSSANISGSNSVFISGPGSNISYNPVNSGRSHVILNIIANKKFYILPNRAYQRANLPTSTM